MIDLETFCWKPSVGVAFINVTASRLDEKHFEWSLLFRAGIVALRDWSIYGPT